MVRQEKIIARPLQRTTSFAKSSPGPVADFSRISVYRDENLPIHVHRNSPFLGGLIGSIREIKFSPFGCVLLHPIDRLDDLFGAPESYHVLIT
jgi:hypothetical protein